MNPHLHIRHCRTFADRLTALGGTMPADLQSLLDAAEATEQWSPGGDALALGKAIQSREYTAETAARFLQDEFNRPARNVEEIRADAVNRIVRAFNVSVLRGGADEAIESLRPTFEKAKAGFDEASNWITPSTTAEQVLEAGDEAGAAWRALAEHKRMLDQLYSFVHSSFLYDFRVITPQPFMDNGERESVCAFFVPATFPLGRAAHALEPLRNAGRGGRWTVLRAATQIEWNTLTVARQIIDDQQEAYAAARRAEHERTHA
ncbi:hypothetical protein ACTD5D_33235 [Nocardia takedensis]|uniref:hypothetical protein n=1 Tax=Nocardia takedensis TaxID=259390 RepID=UPI003F76535B